MTDNLRDRRGAIHVTGTMARAAPEELLEAFQSIGFIPSYIESRMDNDESIYYGCAKEFPEVPEGQLVPHFWIEITVADNGDKSYKAVLQ